MSEEEEELNEEESELINLLKPEEEAEDPETTQLEEIQANSKKHSKALNATLSDIIVMVILISIFAVKDGMPLWSAFLLIATLLSNKLITYVRILLTGEVADAKEAAIKEQLVTKDRELELLKENNSLKKDLEREIAVKQWELKATVYKAVIINEELNEKYDLDNFE